jgi:hypothetical protein
MRFRQRCLSLVSLGLMRELIDRFTYRFQLWHKERYGDRWGADPTAPRNPLRVIAVLSVIFLILDATEPFVFHRSLDILAFVRIPAIIAFLVLYWSASRWAWHVPVGWLVFSFIAYWSFRFGGFAPYQPRAAVTRFELAFGLFDVVLTAGILIWLFWIRERYFQYVSVARANET